MKIKDVVGECLVKMGQTDFSNEQTLDEQQTELKNKLLASINIIYREIVSEYLPLYHTETVNFSGGKVNSSALTKKILYPVKVVKNNRKQSFFSGADGVYCDIEGEAQLTYAYMPSAPLAYTDEINDMRLHRRLHCPTAHSANTTFKTKRSTLQKVSTPISGRKSEC